MAEVQLRSVDKFYGSQQALYDISLDIADGEFVVFVGPSGCGKSTLLRSIAGLEPIKSGAISIGDRDVSALAPSERDVAMVFQSYALYPHMTVRENIDFGMKINKFSVQDRQKRIADAARILQLDDYLDRKPGQLSGRTASARCHRQSYCEETVGVSVRRASIKSGCQAACANACGA